MEAQIRPEPTPEERSAILAALTREEPDEPDPRGAWWRLGVEESLDGAPPALEQRSRERVSPAG